MSDLHTSPEQIGPQKPKWYKAYSFLWVTLILFVASWLLQFTFQVAEVANDAVEHGSQFQWSEFWPQFFSSTFENWQSEFLQLFWQALGLSFLYSWGSSQSRESDDRMEEKIDELLRRTEH